MRRRSFNFTLIQILLCIVIIGLTVVLFVKSGELTILYPVVFGLSALLSVMYAFEGIIYNRNRVVNKGRIFVFILVALALGFLSFFSAKAVL